MSTRPFTAHACARARFRVVLADGHIGLAMLPAMYQGYVLALCLISNFSPFANQTLSIAGNNPPNGEQIEYGFLISEPRLQFFNVSSLENFPRDLNAGPTSTLVSDEHLDDLLRTSRVRIRPFASRFTSAQNKQLTWEQPGWLPWNALGARPRETDSTPRNDSSTQLQQLKSPEYGHCLEHHSNTLQCTEYRPLQQYNNSGWLFQANHSTENSFDSVHTFSYTFYDGLYHQSFADISYAQHTGPDSCNMWLKSCISSTASSVLLLLLLTTIVVILSFTYYSIPIQVRLYTHQLSQEFWRHSTAAMHCLITSVAHHCSVASCRHYDVQAKYLNAQQRKYGLSIYERAIYYAMIYTEGSQPTYMKAAHFVALHLFDVLQAIATVPQPMRFLCAQTHTNQFNCVFSGPSPRFLRRRATRRPARHDGKRAERRQTHQCAAGCPKGPSPPAPPPPPLTPPWLGEEGKLLLPSLLTSSYSLNTHLESPVFSFLAAVVLKLTTACLALNAVDLLLTCVSLLLRHRVLLMTHMTQCVSYILWALPTLFENFLWQAYDAWQLAIHLVTILVIERCGGRRLLYMTLACYALQYCQASPDDHGGTSKPPSFDGTRGAFTTFLVSLTGWVLWKATEVADHLQEPPGGDIPARDYDALGAETDESVKARRDWTIANRKLYGILLSAVPPWLATSLHLTFGAAGNGRGALTFLRDRFDAVDPNDLAAAMAQIHVSQINPRADINEDDLRLQVDAMLVANNAIHRAHGTRFTDEVLIPMFDNALPPAYSTIRQLIRQRGNTDFSIHVQMYMSQVKAELACRQPVPHAFATFGTVLPHAPSSGGRGGRKGGGRGGRGAGGKGRGAGNTTLNPCLRCLLTNHTRPQCNKQPVQCQYCGADHHHTICFHASAPGGARRDSLSSGAAALVKRECGAPTHSTALSTVANPAAAQHPATVHSAATSEIGDGTESQAASTAGTSQLTHSIAAQSATVAQWPPVNQPGVGIWMVHLPNLATDALAAFAARMEPSTGTTAPARLPDYTKRASAYVDSMTTLFVVNSVRFLRWVTDTSPQYSADTIGGPVPIDAVGIAEIWIPFVNGNTKRTHWRMHTVHNVLVCSSSPVECLYSTRVMERVFGYQHLFGKDCYISAPEVVN